MVCTKDVNYANRMIQKITNSALVQYCYIYQINLYRTSNVNCNPYEITRARNRRFLAFPHSFYIRYVIEINALFILTHTVVQKLETKSVILQLNKWCFIFSAIQISCDFEIHNPALFVLSFKNGFHYDRENEKCIF